MKLNETLHMPKTNFEMRGNLNIKEPELVKHWEDINLYNLMNENKNKDLSFILHDGPPYANGNIHCGHMLNRILKDFIIRYKNMSGFYTPFVLGWDTHGLPIENKVTKSGVNRKTTPIVDFRKCCHDYALTQIEKQKTQMLRLGVLSDIKHPYYTLNKEFEAQEISLFGEMALKGLIYKGLKPVYWSPSSESALAEAEIEYKDVTSSSIYVAFKVKDGKGILDEEDQVIIWTTTPWTIPANLAVSAHPDFVYGLFKTNKGKFLILEEFKALLTETFGFEDVELLKTFKGKQLEGVVLSHPLYGRDSFLIVGTHVTNDAGTGFVHTAPGHGAEDFVVCSKYGIKPYCPVDSRGYMDASTGEGISGLFYEEANKVVLERLKENSSLILEQKITHSYPHDWRTGKPLIFRATDQWFCSIEPIREKLLKAIHEVKWHPSWGEQRMVNMIKDRSDWCISRQRAWGVPIPIIYCEDKTPIIEKEVFEHISNLFKEFGSDIWYIKEAKDLLPLNYTNKHSPNGLFSKETDIMDVWFDSGSSFNEVLKRSGFSFPANLYLEGNDQYRGWFNSSLIVSVATYGRAPYKEVVSHGWVMDENWDKMSKSKGNGIDPSKIANIFGADILRLWTAGVGYTQDVRISEPLIKQVSEIYRKIRNTFKFMLGNLADFNVETDIVEIKEKVDLFILARLQEVIRHVDEAFSRYDFSSVISEVTTFMSTDLSSFYLDISKDVLYCDSANSFRRKSIQTVIYRCLDSLVRVLTPILPFTMEEVNANIPGNRPISSQLLEFVKPNNEDITYTLQQYKLFLDVRADVLKALEEARSKDIIHSAQEALVELHIKSSDHKKVFEGIDINELARLFVISEIKYVDENKGLDLLTSSVNVVPHQGEKCDRCWNRVNDFTLDDEGHKLCKRCLGAIKK